MSNEDVGGEILKAVAAGLFSLGTFVFFAPPVTAMCWNWWFG